MNLFFLDKDLTLCARYHVDLHCVKMITEANQVLASAYPKGIAPYRITHFNHPASIWSRASLTNFNWVVNYALELSKEYTFRYAKTHRGEEIANWYLNNQPEIPDIGFTNPPRCFGEFKNSIPLSDDVYQDYRNYYKIGKKHLFAWKNREVPNWI